MSGYFESAFSKLSPEEIGELEESVKAFHELQKSADRVTAIIGCAIVDDQLRKAIERRLIKNEKAIKKYFEDKAGPGHDTSAKIQTAFLLGVFGDETRENLQSIASRHSRCQYAG